jgi:hypothetical protein
MGKPTFRFSFVLEVLDPFLEHADGIVESVDCVGELRVKSERNAELKRVKNASSQIVCLIKICALAITTVKCSTKQATKTNKSKPEDASLP